MSKRSHLQHVGGFFGRKLTFMLIGIVVLLSLALFRTVQPKPSADLCPRTAEEVMARMQQYTDITAAYIVREPLLSAPRLIDGPVLDTLKQIIANPERVSFNYAMNRDDLGDDFDYIVTFTGPESLQFTRQRRGYYDPYNHIILIPAESVWWPTRQEAEDGRRQCYQNVALWVDDRTESIIGSE